MQIPKEKLDKILEMYKPECKYLTECDLDYPTAKGIFKLGDTYYTTRPCNHMTSIEAQLCLNQLGYAAFGIWVPEGRIEKPRISFENYLKLMRENMFIIESQIRFRKPIKTGRPLSGEISVCRIKKIRDLYIAVLDYDIEFGKSTGRIELSLKLSP